MNKIIFNILLVLLPSIGFSQNNNYNKAQHEVLSLIDSAAFYVWSSPDFSLTFSVKAEDKAKQINFIEGIIFSLKFQSSAFYIKGYTDKALKKGIEAIEACEKNNFYKGIPPIANTLGLIYEDLQKFKKAIIYFDKAIKYGKEMGVPVDVPINNKANALYYLKDYKTSLKLHKQALKIRQKNNDTSGIADCKNDIGIIYIDLKQYNKAFQYIHDCYLTKEAIQDTEGIAFSSLDLANLFVSSNKPRQAIKYIDRGFEMANEMNSPRYKEMAYEMYAKAYSLMKDFENAYKYQLSFSDIRDSLKNNESIKKIAEMQTKYETEKKEQTLKLRTAQFEKEKLESRKKTIQRNFTFLGLVLLLILVFIIFRSYRQKQKANFLLNEQKKQISEKNEELNQQAEELKLLNENLHQQNEEITAQRDEIEYQKEKIEIIHHEVSQSIDYATRLQQSILPETKVLNKYLSDNFVFFRPKDKVSGDFYWWTHIENHTIITAADCTGHGVPGAFMSMLGISFLREIVNKEYITHSGVILRKLRKEIIKALKQTGESGEQKDGMDMAIISIDHETNIVQFAGANNSLYIITKDARNLPGFQNLAGLEGFYEVKPDKMPIAIYERMDNFTTHEIQVQDGDQIYLFSDGFADQFGGQKNKKFKYKPFKELLLSNAGKPMREQKEILEKTFDEWIQGYEQIDDIVILGIKI